MISRTILWLFIVATLIVLFFFARRRFRQVMWVVGLSMAAEVILHLLSMNHRDVGQLISEGYFVLGIAVFYGVVWFTTRHLAPDHRSSQKRKRVRQDRTR